MFIFLVYIMRINYIKEKEQFARVYPGTRLCNHRGCDVRYVTERDGKLCLR
jgi:hypothetical protein